MSRYHFWNFYICKHSYMWLSLWCTHPHIHGLDCVSRSVTKVLRDVIFMLYSTTCQATHGTLSSFGLPISRGIIKLEGIQQGITKMIRGFQNLKNEEKLKEICLLDLEKSMLREGNLITVLQYWRIFIDMTEVLLSLFP